MAMSWGLNAPDRSRGMSRAIFNVWVNTVIYDFPLRRFGWPEAVSSGRSPPDFPSRSP
jgi:hypothetical protein